MRKNLQDGFKLIKNITKKIEYYSGFEYVIKLVDVVVDTENKTYIRVYSNFNSREANGRPCTTEKDEYYQTIDAEEINADTYRKRIFPYVKPTFTLSDSSGTYVDSDALEFAKKYCGDVEIK